MFKISVHFARKTTTLNKMAQPTTCMKLSSVVPSYIIVHNKATPVELSCIPVQWHTYPPCFLPSSEAGRLIHTMVCHLAQQNTPCHVHSHKKMHTTLPFNLLSVQMPPLNLVWSLLTVTSNSTLTHCAVAKISLTHCAAARYQ